MTKYKFMKLINKIFFFYFIVFCFPAHAYLDPGSFSIVLQSILTVVAGVVVTYKLWIYKIKDFLDKKKANIKTKIKSFKLKKKL